MDFGNAVLLVGAVFLAVTFVFAMIPDAWENNRQLRILIVLAVGQIITVVVANSDWGAKQIVDGLALENMNGPSLFIVGLSVAGLAAIANRLIEFSIPSIGESIKKLSGGGNANE
jgi:hypothetical protein